MKKVVLRKWQLHFIGAFMFSAGIAFSLTYLTSEVIIPQIFAATSPWTQTDWSGGTASGTVTGTVTTYESESNIDLTAGTEFSLDYISGWSNDYTSWKYRKKLTFDNTDATLGLTTEALVNFPVLIKLDSGSDIDYTKTENSGEDIRFTDSDGTVLSYEIEDWNESGTSYVWVKVPQIDQNSSTDYIYMYYGNSGASDSQSPTSVWDSDYVGVWHMNETSGTSLDSTSNDLDLTARNSPDQDETGKIDGGADFTGNGDALHNTTDSVTFGTELTLEGWFNRSGSGTGSGRILEFSPTGDADSHALAVDSNGSLRGWTECNNGSRVGSADDSTTYGTGTWYYYVYTYDGSVGRIYVNGTQTATSSSSCSDIADTNDTIIGAISDGDGTYSLSQHEFDGDLDEHRASNSLRTPAWIKASYASMNDTLTSYASEEERYESSGTLTSNIFDAGFPADWGTLTFNSSGSGTVTVKARSDSSSDMSGATAWGSCTGITSGADISSNGCIDDEDQYFQYQVTLAPSSADTSSFEDISLAFTASDQIVPPTNATNVSITGVSDGAWTNTEPVITWTAGADNGGGVGLAGYCIALDEVDPGSSDSLDPASSADMLTGLDDGISVSDCPYIVSGTSVDLSGIAGLTLTSGKQYYISMKAIDLAGNIWTGSSGDYQDLYSFKYDNVKPSNPSFISMPSDFIATEIATITWPTSGGNEATDASSGIAGLQYRIGASGTWYGDSHTGGEDADDLLTNDGSYTTQETPDFASIEEGNNLVYFRTWDTAGNVSTTYVSGVLKVNSVAPGVPQSLAVTPDDATTNSYAFSWDAPTTFTGSESNLTYCYTVNTLPTSNTCTFTSAGQTSLSAGAYATQPSANTMYIVAKDEAGNINYDTYASIEFTYSGSAPGIAGNIDISDISIKATSNWKLALAWDEPSDTGAGIEDYKVYRSTTATSCSSSFSSFTEIGTTAGTSYTDTGLSQTDYYYCVKACDSANSCGAVSSTVTAYPDGKFTSAASLTSGPAASSITTQKATITWTTDRTSDSKVAFGTSSGSYSTEEVSSSGQTTDHTINLTNLDAGTTYFYIVKWTDEDGNTGQSSEKSFSTDPAPVIKDVKVQAIGINSANVQFTVTGATKAKIYYGPTTTFGGLAEISTSTVETVYTVPLSGLSDDTKYFYKINAFDSEDEEYEGTTLDFTTLPRPRISNVLIQEVRQAANPTVLVTWDTNTDVSSIITYYPEGNSAAARDEVNVARTSGRHRMLLKGLSNNARYAIIVKGVDKAGNEAQSDIQTFTTATDTRPPVISDLVVEGNVNVAQVEGDNQTVQMIVSWNTDEPSTSQVEFGEGTGSSYSQQTQEDKNLTFNHVVIIPGLTQRKVYHLRAISKDEGGNVGKSIDTVTITPRLTDDALDLVLSNLRETFGFLDAILSR